MRLLVMLSVCSLSLAAPLPACEQTSSPLNATFTSPNSTYFAKCWTFQCNGTVHITFLNFSASGMLSLVNSNGYQLTSLMDYHDNYTASYPANGEMTILYNDIISHDHNDPVNFTVEWECDEDTSVVPPAEGYDTSDYLTLAQTGTYERLFSQKRDHNWIIPCTGTLSIAERLGIDGYVELVYGDGRGKTLLDWMAYPHAIPSIKEYQVLSGAFQIQLRVPYTHTDNFFFFSWSCNGVRPTLPPFGETGVPATRAPVPTPLPATPTPTTAPLSACEETSSPLNATFPPENAYQYMKCWTFQCNGTVHMTFLNFSAHGVLSLVNSNGYQLASLMDYHDNYTASYPANGEMMILYHDTDAYYYYDTVDITVEWGCDEDTPVVPPAEGYDSSDYLTLAQSGTYERLFSQKRDYKWIIPCTGTLSIAERGHFGFISSYAYLTYINSNGSTVLRRSELHSSSSNEYEVRGDFLIQLSCTYTSITDNFIFLSWSCNGVRPTLPPFGETAVPAPRVPPTTAPLPACEQTSSPLNASFPPENAYQYMKCWTFQCKGTAHMTFLNFSAHGMLSLLNSDGYQLASLMDYHDNYTASYPANGEMTILYHDTDAYYYYDTVDITVEWGCDEDTPVVPSAEGYNSSDYLTLAQTGTYERLFSQKRDYKWIIPCTGTLSIEERFDIVVSFAELTYINSNGGTVMRWSGRSSSSRNEYEVHGHFLIELSTYYTGIRDNSLLLSWSCDSVSGPPLTNSPVYSFAPTTYPPDTRATTPDHPAGSSVAPTDLPAGTTFAPPTSAPPTALPTATPTDLPAGATFAPPTSAPPTALPTATPTDLPAGATFAPPPPPSVNALCTTDEDCRSGRLDPKSTCEDGTCVCHTQGYTHPPGVPLCLLADDVTVPMAFAVEYDGVEAQSLWTTTATKRESFEDTMGEALGTVTDMRVVVSDGGVLVVGMVRASTAKLADVLSGKEDLSAALSSSGVSVSHGVTCARTDASYTVQHNGVCNAVECEGNTTLTLADGTYRCEREAPQPEEAGSGSGSKSGSGSESSGSSKVFLYVGIGVGVLGVAVGVVVAFCCLHKKQHAKEPKDLLFEVPLAEAELYHLEPEQALH